MNRYDILLAIGAGLVVLALSWGMAEWGDRLEKKRTQEIIREMVKQEALK